MVVCASNVIDVIIVYLSFGRLPSSSLTLATDLYGSNRHRFADFMVLIILFITFAQWI